MTTASESACRIRLGIASLGSECYYPVSLIDGMALGIHIMRRALFAVALLVGCAPEPESAPPAAGDRIHQLYAQLNLNPDIAHSDYTPAVHELIRVGRPAVPRGLELMLSEDEDTRLRAQRVLEGVTLVEHGFVFGQGWTRQDGEANFRRFWARLGELNYRAPPDKRAASVELWRAWLAEEQPE
jgi:hypothetical protein